jgi:hypothetical protein
MKFANSVLAAALASTASAQNCATKSGQIQVIQPLTSAWKLYNNQVAFNAVVDEKLSNASDAKTAKDAAISAHHASVATGIDSASSTRTGAVDTEHTEAQAALVTKHDQAKAAIEATYQAALTASQAAHDTRQTNLDAAIVAEEARVTTAAAADVIKADGVGAAASTKRADANAAAAAVKTADALQVTAKLAVEDTRDADIRVRYGAKLASQIALLNDKYEAIDSGIEGTKYDIAATLAALDSAGPGAEVDYAANCIVDIADALVMVKDELSPTEIWTEVVINDGTYSARGTETSQPTNAPTDAPIDAPTYAPTDVLTGVRAALESDHTYYELVAMSDYEARSALAVKLSTKAIASKNSDDTTVFGLQELLLMSDDDLIALENDTLQVCKTPTTAALMRHPYHDPAYPATKCIDGDPNTFCVAFGWNNWLRVTVDLPAQLTIATVDLYNRADCCQDRLGYHEIWIGDSASGANHNTILDGKDANSAAVVHYNNIQKKLKGTYVYVSLPGDYNRILNLGEVKIKHFCD